MNWKRGLDRIIWVVSVIASVAVGTGAALEWYSEDIYGEHSIKTFITSILVGFVCGFVGFASSWIAYWGLRFSLLRITIPILKWIKSGFADQPLAADGKTYE